MKITSLADAKAKLSAYLQQCKAEGPIVITRNGKPVAVLISRRSVQAGKGLSRDEFWKAVAKRSREKGEP